MIHALRVSSTDYIDNIHKRNELRAGKQLAQNRRSRANQGRVTPIKFDIGDYV